MEKREMLEKIKELTTKEISLSDISQVLKINEYVEENTSLGNIKLLRKIYGFVVKNIK